MHRAFVVFNLWLLDYFESQVCMLWYKSALYAQHNSYKLWTKNPIRNTTHWMVIHKKKVIIYFEVEIWNHLFLTLFSSNIWVLRRKSNSWVPWSKRLPDAKAVSTFVCPAHVTAFYIKVHIHKIWDTQIYTHPSIFWVSYPPRGYKNSPGRPNRKHITLTLKWVEASKLFDNSNNSPRYSSNLFQELHEPKPLNNTTFLQKT